MKREQTKDGFKQISWKDLFNVFHEENPDVDKETYYDVVAKYFDVYFGELYFSNKPKYFFLSGMMRKVRGRKFFSYKTGKYQRHDSINFLWYYRPALSYFTNIKMMKRTSTKAILQAIEKEWRIANDVELLTPLNYEMNSVKLYKDD